MIKKWLITGADEIKPKKLVLNKPELLYGRTKRAIIPTQILENPPEFQNPRKSNKIETLQKPYSETELRNGGATNKKDIRIIQINGREKFNKK